MCTLIFTLVTVSWACLTVPEVIRLSETPGAQQPRVSRYWSDQDGGRMISEAIEAYYIHGGGDATRRLASLQTLDDFGFTKKHFQALEEIADQSSKAPILSGLSKEEREQVRAIDADGLKALSVDERKAIRARLEKFAEERIAAIPAQDVNLRAKTIARELAKNFSEADQKAFVAKSKLGEDLKTKIKKCLGDPECWRPPKEPGPSITHVSYGAPSPAIINMASAQAHVAGDHLVPSKLVEILDGLNDPARSATARAAARKLASAVSDRVAFKDLSSEAKREVKDLGLDQETWDFMARRSSKPKTSFFRDRDHLEEIQKRIEARCSVGDCIASRTQIDGRIEWKLEESGARYTVIYCTQVTSKCSEVGRVITYYPECGPGIYGFSATKFLDAMNAVAKGDSAGYRSAAASYEFIKCK